ncbi:MAG: 4,5-DOPA dioxygenase extradiol [Bacteroidetes bacterium]|nr:4,5-DOPA dioxygenase extradiol [Bacteroidota bacterium]
MNRKQFLASLALIPLSQHVMKLTELNKLSSSMERTGRMPVLFIGHGSPMNALEHNEFTQGWQSMAAAIPKPNAIICISAHWETKGTFVTSMAMPKTIHDFGGFPQKLFDVQYPAPGSPELASEVQRTVGESKVGLDDKWGFDHGAWSVIMQMYPDASVPVIQLSLDYSQNTQYQYNLARQLAPLREKGVLIIGSGNMIHNLRAIDWSGKTQEFDWAVEANATFKKLITGNEHQQLINYQKLGTAVAMAIPTPEHYLPLLYVLALKNKDEEITFFNDKTVMGSISMTSLKI